MAKGRGGEKLDIRDVGCWIGMIVVGTVAVEVVAAAAAVVVVVVEEEDDEEEKEALPDICPD